MWKSVIPKLWSSWINTCFLYHQTFASGILPRRWWPAAGPHLLSVNITETNPVSSWCIIFSAMLDSFNYCFKILYLCRNKGGLQFLFILKTVWAWGFLRSLTTISNILFYIFLVCSSYYSILYVCRNLSISKFSNLVHKIYFISMSEIIFFLSRSRLFFCAFIFLFIF